MKWFQHNSNLRNELEMKLIRSKFGAEGYGIYMSLKEVVAEFIEINNPKEWGSVNPLHTIDTLAKECDTTPETLKKFLEFCNEKKIFLKKDGRLFDPLIEKELDNFFTRINRKKHTTKSVRTKSEVKKK